MACGPCAAARAAVAQNAKAGNVTGTIRAIGAGAKLMAQKLTGTAAPSYSSTTTTAKPPTPYVRRI